MIWDKGDEADLLAQGISSIYLTDDRCMGTVLSPPHQQLNARESNPFSYHAGHLAHVLEIMQPG